MQPIRIKRIKKLSSINTDSFTFSIQACKKAKLKVEAYEIKLYHHAILVGVK